MQASPGYPRDFFNRLLVLVGDFEPGWLRRFIVDLILAQVFYGRMYRNEKI